MKEFLRKFRTSMMNAKIQLISLVEPEKLGKTQVRVCSWRAWFI